MAKAKAISEISCSDPQFAAREIRQVSCLEPGETSGGGGDDRPASSPLRPAQAGDPLSVAARRPEATAGRALSPMSALPCPLPNRFAQADQDFEKIVTFLSGEANQLSYSDVERQVGEMVQDMLRKMIMQAYPEMGQPGQAQEQEQEQEPVRDAAGTTLMPT